MTPENPIHPFWWEARYAGGGRLQQFDVDGWHRPAEIDRTRLVELVVHNHASGLLVLPARSRTAHPDPDAVVVRVSWAMIHEIRENRWSRRRTRLSFELWYGEQVDSLVLRPDGAGFLPSRNGKVSGLAGQS
jgi:hypothetical protein